MKYKKEGGREPLFAVEIDEDVELVAHIRAFGDVAVG